MVSRSRDLCHAVPKDGLKKADLCSRGSSALCWHLHQLLGDTPFSFLACHLAPEASLAREFINEPIRLLQFQHALTFLEDSQLGICKHVGYFGNASSFVPYQPYGLSAKIQRCCHRRLLHWAQGRPFWSVTISVSHLVFPDHVVEIVRENILVVFLFGSS